MKPLHLFSLVLVIVVVGGDPSVNNHLDPRVYPFSVTQAGVKNYRSVEWYEATGPRDKCQNGGGSKSIVNQGGDESVLGNRRGSMITVCKRSLPGDEKCICVRRQSNSTVFDLECGMCLDPCAMQFVPLDTTGTGTTTTTTGTTGSGSQIGANAKKVAAAMMDMEKNKKDFKDMLLSTFLKEILNGTEIDD